MNPIKCLILCFFIPLSMSSQALQRQSIAWDYEWISADGAQRSISINIDVELARQAFTGPSDLLDFTDISEILTSEVKRMASSLSDAGIFISAKGDRLDELVIEYSSYPQYSKMALKRVEDINLFIKEAMQPVEDTTYYQYDEKSRSVNIDYNHMAKDYQVVVLDLLIALTQYLGTDDPDVLKNELITLLQSIEYSSLDDDDFPLFNPARMLIERRGDCESKQLFMGIALKLLEPDLTASLVLLPDQEHIVLMQTQANGLNVYMDATGPVYLPIGSLDPSTSLIGERIDYPLVF